MARSFQTSPQQMDDSTLVAGLQRGDARAVEHVVGEFAPALYRYAYYQLHDATAAEDLVAEVMVRMIQKVDGFVVGPTPFQAWLYRIARNLVVDNYRAAKRHPQVSFEGWLAADPTNEPGQDDGAISSLADRGNLVEGLALLTAEQRQVILLHVVEGWDLPQVAHQLGRSVPSVKSLYYRGIGSLRRVLIRNGDNESDLAG